VAVDEGAALGADGAGRWWKAMKNGFYLGPEHFDHVRPGMSIGEQEILGLFCAVKRVILSTKVWPSLIRSLRKWFGDFHP